VSSRTPGRYAMTVHKSEGAQFDTAAVVLAPPASPVLTRELLYTAVTRARGSLIRAGTEEAVRAAVAAGGGAGFPACAGGCGGNVGR
jgi:exodeoxyribonuclease V alpha subunit